MTADNELRLRAALNRLVAALVSPDVPDAEIGPLLHRTTVRLDAEVCTALVAARRALAR